MTETFMILSPDRQERLKKQRVQIKENIRIKDTVFLDYLEKEDVITNLQRKTQETRRDHKVAGWLLDHLKTRTDRDYDIFCDALKHTKQAHLAKCMKIIDATGEMRRLSSWQEDIALHYQRYFGNIQLCPYGPAQKLRTIDCLYTATKCVMLDKDSQQETPIDDVDEIFKKGSKPTMTYLQGSPGCGKSTLVSWALYSWAKHVLHENGSAERDPVLAESNNERRDLHYNTIINITLRDVKQGATFMDTVRDQIAFQDPESVADLEYFIRSNPSDVLFIADGLDEYHPNTSDQITQILNGQLFPRVSKVVTSRHTKSDSPVSKLVRYYDRQVELKGFDAQQILTYIYKYMTVPSCPNANLSADERERNNHADALYKEINDKEILSLCSVPLHLSFICQLDEAGQELSETKTELFIQMLKYMIDVNQSKESTVTRFNIQTLNEYHSDVLSCGTKALSALLGPKNRFNITVESELEDPNLAQRWCRLALIVPVKSVNFRSANEFTYPHLSIQEMLAAYSVVHSDEQKELLLSHLSDIHRLHDCRQIIQFVCGLSEKTGNVFLRRASELTRHESPSTPTVDQCPYFNPKSWLGNIQPKAQAIDSTDLSHFIAQCLGEYKDVSKADFPLPSKLTIDLEQKQTNALLQMVDNSPAQSHVERIAIQNGHLTSQVQNIFSVTDVTKLRFLFVRVTACEDILRLTSHIKQMVSLKTLIMKVKHLHGNDHVLMSALGQHVSLTRLVLRYFDLRKCCKEFVTKLSLMSLLVQLRLTDIDLSVVGKSMTFITQSVHMTHLMLKKTNMDRSQIISLCSILPSKCPNLLWVELDHNGIAASATHLVEAMSQLKYLQVLKVAHCQISEEEVRHLLQNLPHSLRALDISGNPLSQIPPGIENAGTLTRLNYLICKDTGIYLDNMTVFRETCPELKIICDSESERIFARSLAEFHANILSTIYSKC